MFREFILLIYTTSFAFGNYRIIFDKVFSPPSKIPAINEMYYSVPLNQTISKPIIAYISHTDGTRVWSGTYSHDVYKVISVASNTGYNQTALDTWQVSGGKLCQRAVWWEDYPTKFDTSRAKTRCGDTTSSTTLLVTAFKGRLILDGIFHQHNAVPNQTRILRIIHNSGTLQAETHPFQITRPAKFVEVYIQAPKQVIANDDFSLTVRIRDQEVSGVDVGLDSIAVVELSIPYTYKIFYNTKEKGMMLKSTSVRLAGKETIIHQSNRDRVIRKAATRGKVRFDFIRILDPIKDIKINVTMMKARTPWSRVPNCETCYNDIEYQKYLANGTELTFRPMSTSILQNIKSLTFSDPVTIIQQTLHRLSFSRKTLDFWTKWTDPLTNTVSVTKNIKIPGEIFLEALDRNGHRIYAGDDSTFSLRYQTIPNGICLSKDVTKTVKEGGAHLLLSFCEIVNGVVLTISAAHKTGVSVNTIKFRVVGTINVAHLGDFRNKGGKNDLASYMNSFLNFAARDINEGMKFKNHSRAGFTIKVDSFNTMNDVKNTFAQISKIADDQATPSSQYHLVISSANDDLIKATNLQLLKAKLPCISTSNIDTEFSDKFLHPFFNRICWSENSVWKSFAIAARDRNWYRLVVVRSESVIIPETFFDILNENGIVVGKEVIIPAVESHMMNRSAGIFFAEQMKTIQDYMCRVIVLFAEEKSQQYIFTAAQRAGVDTSHGFQWILLHKYVWKFPFTNAGPCSGERLSCTQAFKGIYLMIESYNVSGYLSDDWKRVLTHYYSTNRYDLKGGRIDRIPYEVGGKIALGYDAMLVFADAFMKIVLKKETVSEHSINKFIRQSEINGLTGKIKINGNGDRIGYIGYLAQVNTRGALLYSHMKTIISYIRFLNMISEDEQLEIPFEGTNSLFNNVAELYLPPSHKYNKIKIMSMSGVISLENQTIIPNPCQPWPPQRYERTEKEIPIYSCDQQCGFKLLSESNVTNYDSGVCIEGNNCQCKPGYTGTTCMTILCKCVHGKCLKPYNCTCDPGWVGNNCEKAVCHKCDHGKCVSPDECDCDTLWSGPTCNINLLAVLFPLIFILILLAILSYFFLKKIIRQLKHREIMTTNDWIVDWKSVEHCNIDEYVRTWVVLSPSKEANYFKHTYKWKDKKWYVKKIPSHTIPLTDLKFREEMVNLVKVKHPNLVTYGGACIDAPNVSLFLPVADRGSLNDILKLDAIEFSWDFRFSFMKDICRGMEYLHQKTNIGSHGRLSSYNCLVDYRWTVRISGYGVPTLRYGPYRKEIEIETEDIRQFLWTAPELLENITNVDDIKNGSKPGDVYAFAIIVAEILTRDEPYAYELQYISIRCLMGLIRDYASPVLKNTRTKWREMAGPNMMYVRPIIAIENLGFNMMNRNIVRHMLADSWNQIPSLRPTFKKINDILYKLHKIKTGSIENQMNLFVTYSKNLELILVERMIEMEAQTDKYELSLSQLLPKKYATEIKQGHTIYPETFECVTIFTSDVVDFFKISQTSTPRQMVNFLNEIFYFFDVMITGYNAYRIDTISDFHMIVSGLDGTPKKKSADEIASMALDIMTSVEFFKIPHKPNSLLQLRVGIHSGPVLVGVVGRAAPRFCVLGKTIDIALKMLQASEPLRIHISATTAGILYKLDCYQMQGISVDSYWLWGKDNFKTLLIQNRTITSDT